MLQSTRESVREYDSRLIEKEKLDYILEAARLAPSACNKQPYKFFVLESERAKDMALRCCSRFTWLKQAPVIILCCVDHSQEWIRSRYDSKAHGNIDIAIAVEHMCLSAAEQGLGTCWICSFDADLCKEIFGLEENLEPAVLLPVGYPKTEGKRPKVRKSAEDLFERL